eukprot:gene4766-4937_t
MAVKTEPGHIEELKTPVDSPQPIDTVELRQTRPPDTRLSGCKSCNVLRDLLCETWQESSQMRNTLEAIAAYARDLEIQNERLEKRTNAWRERCGQEEAAKLRLGVLLALETRSEGTDQKGKNPTGPQAQDDLEDEALLASKVSVLQELAQLRGQLHLQKLLNSDIQAMHK